MRNMKKVIATLAVLGVAACSASMFAACEEDGHEHVWGDWTTVTAATCDEKGEEERVCLVDFSHKETRDLDALGHAWGDWTDKTPADCTHAKTQERTCANNPEHKETHTVGEADGHEMTHVSASPASCTENGVKEHWTCSVCEKDFADKDGNGEMTDKAEPKKQHEMTHVSASPASCTENGVKEHWTCSVCEKDFADKDGNGEMTDKAEPKKQHEMTHVSASPASCTENGVKEHWTCSVCEITYADKDGTTQLTSTVDVAKGHSMTYSGAVPAGCTTDGVKEHWSCSVCQTHFADKDGNAEMTDLTVPAAHAPVFYGETEAGCTRQGKRAYYGCDVCKKSFFDEACTEEADPDDLIIPASHKLATVAADANTKTVPYPNNDSVSFKNMAYYECEVCNKTFKDEDGTNEITSVYNRARCGMLLEYGLNSVDCTGVRNATNLNTYVSTYIADGSGQYTFTFGPDLNISGMTYILTGTKANVNPPPYANSAWNTASATYGKFVNATQPLTDSVTVNMVKGEWITFAVTVAKFTVNVEKEPVLIFGENTVTVTEAYATDVDVYKFTPAETKTYAMILPEGLSASIGYEWSAEGGVAKNFEGEAGVEIEFTFTSDKTGTYNVTISEEVALPTIALGETHSITDYPGPGGTYTFAVADGVPEGEYTLTFNESTRRASCYVAVNFTGEVRMNGSNVVAEDGWLYFNAFPGQNSKKVVLKAGDTVTVINPIQGTAGAPSFSLS